MTDPKIRLDYILKTLWANRETPTHDLLCELLEMKLQQGKDLLVINCTPENFPIIQGQARAYHDLLALLKKQPVALPKE